MRSVYWQLVACDCSCLFVSLVSLFSLAFCRHSFQDGSDSSLEGRIGLRMCLGQFCHRGSLLRQAVTGLQVSSPAQLCGSTWQPPDLCFPLFFKSSPTASQQSWVAESHSVPRKAGFSAIACLFHPQLVQRQSVSAAMIAVVEASVVIFPATEPGVFAVCTASQGPSISLPIWTPGSIDQTTQPVPPTM